MIYEYRFVYCPVHGFRRMTRSIPLEENRMCGCGARLYELKPPYAASKTYMTRAKGEITGYERSGYICMWHYPDDGTFCGSDVYLYTNTDHANNRPELCKEHYMKFLNGGLDARMYRCRSDGCGKEWYADEYQRCPSCGSSPGAFDACYGDGCNCPKHSMERAEERRSSTIAPGVPGGTRRIRAEGSSP